MWWRVASADLQQDDCEGDREAGPQAVHVLAYDGAGAHQAVQPTGKQKCDDDADEDRQAQDQAEETGEEAFCGVATEIADPAAEAADADQDDADDDADDGCDQDVDPEGGAEVVLVSHCVDSTRLADPLGVRNGLVALGDRLGAFLVALVRVVGADADRAKCVAQVGDEQEPQRDTERPVGNHEMSILSTAADKVRTITHKMR